jgi:hypothetical protein
MGLGDLIPSLLKDGSPTFLILSPMPKAVGAGLSSTIESGGSSSPNILGFLWRFIGRGRPAGRFGDTLDFVFVGKEKAFVVFDAFATFFISASFRLPAFRFDRVTRLLLIASGIVDIGVFDSISGTEGNFFSDGLPGVEDAVSIALLEEESETGELGAGEDELRNGVVFSFLTLLLLDISSSSLDILLPVEIFLS